MTSQSAQPARSVLRPEPDWLWAWNGTCVGYRHGDSLFTCDGRELGRFFGLEVYGSDGHYLGELGNCNDGNRLITNVYKRSRTGPMFVPTFGKAYRRPKDRSQEPLFCGHESFPSLGTANGASGLMVS